MVAAIQGARHPCGQNGQAHDVFANRSRCLHPAQSNCRCEQMITNEKPRTLGTGQINNIDGESIIANGTDLIRQNANLESILSKSSPIITDCNIISAQSNDRENIDEIAKMLREQSDRRKDAAYRLPPLACGCRDPYLCRCKTGAR